jgi:hypothetical protein
MKKIFLLLTILIITVQIQAQVYDEPIDSTAHYHLRHYAQSARIPASILNDDKTTIDSVMYSLIVWVDSTQYQLVLDTAITTTGHLTFKVSNYATGTDTFTTTAEHDTVVIAGADSLGETSDLFFLQPYGSSITSNDVLSYTVNYDTLFVHRPASGTSALKFKWRWIKRH